MRHLGVKGIKKKKADNRLIMKDKRNPAYSTAGHLLLRKV